METVRHHHRLLSLPALLTETQKQSNNLSNKCYTLNLKVQNFVLQSFVQTISNNGLLHEALVQFIISKGVAGGGVQFDFYYSPFIL